MKKVLLVIYFLLMMYDCFAGQNKLDSLLKELNKHPAGDTVRLNLLNAAAYAYEEVNSSKALETADLAIALAKKLNNQPKLAIAYKIKAMNYQGMNEDSLAEQMYMEALKIYIQSGNKKGIATIYNNLGIQCFNLSQYSKALQYHQKAVAILEEMNDSLSLAYNFNSIALNYQYLADYTKALEFYQRALEIFEHLKNRQNIAIAFGNLGILYRNLGNGTKALEYFNKALEIYSQSGNQKGIADMFCSMGNAYDDIDSLSKALEYYNKSFSLSKAIGYDNGIACSLVNIGIVENELSDYPKAYEYLLKSVAFYEQTDDKFNLCIALSGIGKIYYNAPDAFLIQQGVLPEKRYIRALEYQNRALKLAIEIEAVQRQMNVWEQFGKIYEKQKKIPKALDAYKTYMHLHDSILNDEKKSEITKKELQFEFDKKEALLKADHDKKEALAAAEIKRQRTVKNSAMGGAVILILAGLSSFVFYKRRRDAVEQKKESDFKAEVSETEMKALRSQMNPHFIFNSLNSIGDYISRNDNKAADNYLSKFAKVMRMILENSEQKEVSLEDDLKALELYMQLESMRMNNKFTYEVIVDDAIDKENTLIPPLILQPFVENSIWHGISKKQGAGKILIEIKKEGDMILCIVEDNGIGRKKSDQEKEGAFQKEKKSLGMKITRSRIDIINKLKKSKAAVELSDLAEGMRVEVRLPLELSF